MPVYVARLAGAEADYEGAAVSVYIPAPTVEGAVLGLLKALSEDHYALTAIDDLRHFDDLEWGTDEHLAKATAFRQEAVERNNVVFTTFHAWDGEFEH